MLFDWIQMDFAHQNLSKGGISTGNCKISTRKSHRIGVGLFRNLPARRPSLSEALDQAQDFIHVPWQSWGKFLLGKWSGKSMGFNVKTCSHDHLNCWRSIGGFNVKFRRSTVITVHAVSGFSMPAWHDLSQIHQRRRAKTPASDVPNSCWLMIAGGSSKILQITICYMIILSKQSVY